MAEPSCEQSTHAHQTTAHGTRASHEFKHPKAAAAPKLDFDTLTIAQAALAYAKLGLRVLPVARESKRPLTLHGAHDATCDLTTIRDWWKRWPGANVAIALDGLVVVDIDPRHGAPADRDEIAAMLGPWPETAEAITGGGGRHLYFRARDSLQAPGALAPGVDVKSGPGAYVVAPPSLHANGRRYAWDGLDDPLTALRRLPVAPEWVYRRARPRTVPDDEPIPEGQRNETLFRMGCGLRRRGFSAEAILAALLAENQRRCQPPLDETEVRKIADSCARYQPGEVPPALRPQADTAITPAAGTIRVVMPDSPGAQLSAEFVRAPLTDLGNAERLVALFGQDLAWTEAWGWLVWDGQRWAVDSQRRIEELAVATVRAMYRGAAQLDDPDRRKALASWAQRSESRSRIEAMVALARHMVARKAEEFDRDPRLLNLANGTLDLRTGELRPHQRGDRITKLAPVTYDPDARSELWERFLREACGGDQDMIAFLQRAVGYSLTGCTGEEKLFLVHGPGATGKSTFLEAVKATLGDYAWTSDFETFLLRRPGGVRNDIAELAGRRFVISIEVEEGSRLAEGLVKMLTGGDTVRGRFLFREAFQFIPQFKLWLAANHAPKARGDDTALWRRIVRVPFEHVIPVHKRDPQVKARLRDPKESGPAILAWAVQGCLTWQQRGLGIPQAVIRATDEYREQCDPLGRFLRERCRITPHGTVSANFLYQAYRAWCDECGEHPLSSTAFGLRLGERGFDRQRTKHGIRYRGLELCVEDD
jgi:putative DNA primase/helicase